MDAKYIIDRIGDSQDWNDSTKLQLVCAYLDNIEFHELEADLGHGRQRVTVEQKSLLDSFTKWLQNKVAWENSEGLDAGRAG